MKNARYIWLLIFITVITFANNQVSAKPIPYAIPPVNAFTAGIGGAGVAVTDDPAVVYWNPAAFGAS